MSRETLALRVSSALMMGVIVLLVRCPASAQSDARPQLALELAVVAAHEGALDNVRETALVWQVLESRRTTTRGQLELLRQHSPRALGIDACNGGNCAWSADLLRAPSKPPASLDAAWWKAARAERWAAVQRYALELVYGVELWRPCVGSVFTWGYVGDLDGALANGLVPMGCAGVVQDGFALRGPR